MSIKSVLEDTGILVLAVVVGIGIGAAKGYKSGVAHEAPALATAKADTATAENNARTLTTTLTDIRQQLDVQRQTMLAAQQAAQVALDQRDTARVDLAKAQRQRITLDRKTAHETPDCAGLARLSVCPALARRLFPAATAPDTHQRTVSH